MAYQLCLDGSWQLYEQHGSAKGYITVAQRNYTWQEKHYTAEQLPAQIGGADVYNSQNSFYRPVRRIANLKQLRSLFVDLDCYQKQLTPDQALWQLEQDIFGSVMPLPNLIILSGRGLALTWHLNPAPVEALPLWQFAEDWICRQLEYLGADPAATDAARVLRLAGTVNSKNGAMVQALHCHSDRLDLKEWKRVWLPTKPEPAQKKTGGKVNHLFSAYSLHYERMQDIKLLIKLRGGHCDGHREVLLFLYRYYGLLYYKDEKAALEAILSLNNSFVNPLPWREVVRDTRSAERILERGKQYNYSNSKLINVLEITPEEQRQLKTIIGKEEKYRRNNQKREKARRDLGQVTRGEYLSKQDTVTQSRIAAVRGLLQERPYLTIKEIAEQIGASERHVKRLIKLSDK